MLKAKNKKKSVEIVNTEEGFKQEDFESMLVVISRISS